MKLSEVRNKLKKSKEVFISWICEEEENLRRLLIHRGLINLDPINQKIICEKKIRVKRGPWGSTILQLDLQELFLDCYYSSKVFVHCEGETSQLPDT